MHKTLHMCIMVKDLKNTFFEYTSQLGAVGWGTMSVSNTNLYKYTFLSPQDMSTCGDY